METSPTKNPYDIVKGSEQMIGPFFGILVILGLLVIGALYFWNYEVQIKSKSASTATTTEVIIYRHAHAATTTEPTALSTSNAELNILEANLENQMQSINNLNF